MLSAAMRVTQSKVIQSLEMRAIKWHMEMQNHPSWEACARDSKIFMCLEIY